MPTAFLHAPETIDAAVIKLRALARHTNSASFPGLFRILKEIEAIAQRTRALRQRFFLAATARAADA